MFEETHSKCNDRAIRHKCLYYSSQRRRSHWAALRRRLSVQPVHDRPRRRLRHATASVDNETTAARRSASPSCTPDVHTHVTSHNHVSDSSDGVPKKFPNIIADRFSGPGRATGPVCVSVCPTVN